MGKFHFLMTRYVRIAAVATLMAVVVLLIIVLGLSSKTSSSAATPPGSRYQRIAADTPLIVRFTVPMEQEDVTAVTSVAPQVDGKWQWQDDTTLAFLPAAPLALSGTYTVRVAPEIRRSDEAVVGQETVVRFFVAGPPTVAQLLPPPDAADVDPERPITIVFDRPMVALTTISERGTQFANWPVTIEPDVAGTWRWLSSTTVEFAPKNGLAPATKYKVHVPAGLKTVNGEQTETDVSATFTTERPTIQSTEPPEGFDRAGVNVQPVLHFYAAVDLQSVQQHTQLFRMKEGQAPSNEELQALDNATIPAEIGVPVSFKVVYGTVESDGVKKTDKTTVVLMPQAALEWNTWYGLLVSSGVGAPGGNLGSEQPFVMRFKTAGPMEVLSIVQEYDALKIDFSNPYDAKTVKKALTISPKPANWDDIEIDDNFSESTALYLYPAVEPSTKYTVTVGKGLRDIFGQESTEAKTMSFTTKPLEPRVFIHSNGSFGVFEREFPPVVYLNSVNVSQLNVQFAQLSLEEFINFQRAERDNWQFEPVLADKAMYQQWNLPQTKPENEWGVETFDIKERLQSELTPGIYVLTLQAPEYHYDGGIPVVEKIYFSITSTALTLKFSGDKALVWALNMETGEPVAGATIGLHTPNGQQVKSGLTDAAGFFETEIDAADFAQSDGWQPEVWITAVTADDFAYVGTPWDSGLNAYDFSLNQNFQQSAGAYELLSYLYTDRPIYRPGDTVHFKGIVRLKDMKGVLHPPRSDRRVQVTIEDAEYNSIFSQAMLLSAFGSFSGEIPLDPKATLGNYTLRIELTGATDVQNNWDATNFLVLAYRKPEYRVDVTFDKENYFDGDTVRASVEAAYYFGMAMSQSPLQWRAITTDYFFNQYTDGWYSFSLEDNWCWWDCQRENKLVAEGEGKLTADGKFQIEVPMKLEVEALSQVLSIDVDVTDQNNQVVSTRASVPVHKSAIYVGIRSDDWGVEPGSEAQLSLVTVKPDGSPAVDQSVDLTVFERNWNVTRKKGVDGEYYYDSQPQDTKIKSYSAKTGPDGKVAIKVNIPSGGQFRILAQTADAAGRVASADTSVYAWSDTYVNWPRANNNRIEIIADKPEYAVGDTATLIAKSPFQGENVKTLVTVEREGIISRRVITLESSAQPITIPITEDLIPNAYVSVVVVKPREGETFNENGLDTGAPAFRIGYAQLNVETKQKALDLSIVPDKQKYLPGETVNVTLKTKNWSGTPVPAELSLAVIDMSVLDLAGYSRPDLLKEFFSGRGLGVRTAQNLLYLMERFKPGSKGGGGGDPEERARANFKDTAYWNPTIVTDEQGEAHVSFKLPDNLTTWKLIAVGHSKESLVGAYDTEVVETKRVIVRPVRPRFAVQGDEAELATIVVNGTDKTANFKVTLTGDGFEGSTDAQTVSVDAGAQVKVRFPVSFGFGNKANFVFTAETDGARDEVHESIPLYPFGIPQAVATSGFTDESVREQVYLPVRDEVTALQVQAALSPTLAVYLPSSLSYLVNYPYGCAEQTVSSFLPNIAVAELERLDAFEIVDDKTLQTNVIAGIERLITFQRGDGGIGYWEQSPASYPYLTAYVVHALHLARKAGYTVDSDFFNRARDYLEQALRNGDMTRKLHLNERAYVLYVLGETGGVDRSLLSNLYDQRAKLALFAKAYLAMAMEKTGNHKQAQALVDEILQKADVSPRTIEFAEDDLWELRSLMNTEQRSTAIILQAMISVDPENVLIPQITRALLQMRRAGHWDTTQSTVAAIFALVDYLKLTGELRADFTATLTLNGKEVTEAVFNAKNVLTKEEQELPADAFTPGQFNPVDFSKKGEGQLYYDLMVQYFWRAQKAEPAEEGISVVRELTPTAGSPATPSVGGTYKVKLTITVPETRHFVAIESPHPAGFEGIDFALQTTQQHLQDELEPDRPEGFYWWWDSSWYFTHKEFRDDQVFLFADNLPAGVYHYEYLVRATLPGTFKWRPARAYEMYFPEVFGNTESAMINIREP